LKVFEELGKRIDFSTKGPDGEYSYWIPAILAFGAMAVILFVIAMSAKQPLPVAPAQGETARLGAIGACDDSAGS
jgi:hypothetical protein